MTNSNFDISFDAPSKVYDSPLQDFWATGTGWYPVTKQNPGKAPYTIMYLRFGQPGWNLLVTTDTYEHETAEINMFYSAPKESFHRTAKRGISGWEAFSESIREIYYETTSLKGVEILNDLFGGQVDPNTPGSMPPKAGRLMHMERVPTLMNVQDRETKKYYDAVVPTWKVTEVMGVGKAVNSIVPAIAEEPQVDENGNVNTDPVTTVPSGTANAATVMNHALDLANGKTEAQFYEMAMEDEVILQSPGLVEQLNKREWVNQMKGIGMLGEKDGVLVKA